MNPASTASPIVTARETSGISRLPRRRTGTRGAIRRAAMMLISAGTKNAAQPIAKSASWLKRRVVRMLRRSIASYHITSVMRPTAPLSRKRTTSAAKTISPMTIQRRYWPQSPPATGPPNGEPPPVPPLPPDPRGLPRRRPLTGVGRSKRPSQSSSAPLPRAAPLPDGPPRPASLGVRSRGALSRRGIGRPSRWASASCWRRWSSSRSRSSHVMRRPC